MWPFKKAPTPPPTNFVFKPDGFFEMQCKYGRTEIKPGRGIVAIVLDAREQVGAATAVKVEPDGTQLAVLKVASSDGGFIVPAKTPNKGEPLAPLDIVMWVPMTWLKQMAEASRDPRFGWVGLIRAKVKPETTFEPNEPWSLICRYD